MEREEVSGVTGSSVDVENVVDLSAWAKYCVAISTLNVSNDAENI